MLKKLAMLAIAASMAISVSSQPDKTTNQKEPTSKHVVPVAAIHTPDRDTHSQTNQPETRSDPPARNTSFQWPHWVFDSNWWLVIIAALTGLAIGWQARLLRRTLNEVHVQAGHMESQTKILRDSVTAAQDSAKAANDQIKMMKDKERARITVEVMHIEKLDMAIVGTNRITLKFRNLGPTRAFNVTSGGDARPIIPDREPQPFEFVDLGVPAVLEPTPPPAESWVELIFPEEWLDDLLLRPRIRLEVR